MVEPNAQSPNAILAGWKTCACFDLVKGIKCTAVQREIQTVSREPQHLCTPQHKGCIPLYSLSVWRLLQKCKGKGVKITCSLKAQGTHCQLSYNGCMPSKDGVPSLYQWSLRAWPFSD